MYVHIEHAIPLVEPFLKEFLLLVVLYTSVRSVALRHPVAMEYVPLCVKQLF